MTTLTQTLKTRRTTASRITAIPSAAGATLAAWAAIEHGLGVDLRAPVQTSTQTPPDIGPASVLVVTAFMGLAAWALLAILERRTSRATRIWTAVASVVMLASLGGPFKGMGVEMDVRVGLATLHVVFGGLLIALFRRSGPASGVSRG